MEVKECFASRGSKNAKERRMRSGQSEDERSEDHRMAINAYNTESEKGSNSPHEQLLLVVNSP
jgi:hypothetical protein